jgi:predicted lipoprotein with Yx(FWY)xxD motif
MRRQLLIIAVAGAAVTGAVLAAVGTASTFTLRARKGEMVNNSANAAFAAKPVNKTEAVAVGPTGFPVYTFQGETTHHLICKKTDNASTNCWAFWPPVSPASAHGLSKPASIHGKLGTFHNHGVLQLTLGGRPLYYFQPDISSHNKHLAGGDELNTFGSIWHVVVAHVAGATSTNAPTSTTPSSGGGGSGYGPGW